MLPSHVGQSLVCVHVGVCFAAYTHTHKYTQSTLLVCSHCRIKIVWKTIWTHNSLNSFSLLVYIYCLSFFPPLLVLPAFSSFSHFPTFIPNSHHVDVHGTWIAWCKVNRTLEKVLLSPAQKKVSQLKIDRFTPPRPQNPAGDQARECNCKAGVTVLLWWHSHGSICVYPGIRVLCEFWMCVWLLTFWALCLSTSSSSSLPATVERECWVTEVWSSPGLTPDLLSLLPLFPQSSPPSPLTSTCFPLFLLARSLMSDIVRVCVHVDIFPNSLYCRTPGLFFLLTVGHLLF